MRIYTLKGLPFDEYINAGGKARGLSELMEAGLYVAPGFVIIDINGDDDFNKCADYFLNCGIEKAAVRSSATNEDGADFSGAGQYSTFLNVSGRDDFIKALKGCLDSLNNNTASAYSKFFSQDTKRNSMSIVVQEMVDAVYAGVGFTSDPVTGKKNLVVEAVKGLGEALVSGHASAQRYNLEINNSSGAAHIVIPSENEAGMLSKDYLSKIGADMLKAAAYFNKELDMEWAVSQSGALVWLQARPITTLNEATADEFDMKNIRPNTVFTTCNIGEMLPGVVTPLTLSTSVMAIDAGLSIMFTRSGSYKKREIKPNIGIVSFSNQLFFNLTSIYKIAASVIGADKTAVEMSICGKYLDTPPSEWKKRSGLVRLINGMKYFKYLFSRKKAMKKIDKLLAAFSIPYHEDIILHYEEIDSAMPVFVKATSLHYMTSSHSGAMSSALLTVLLDECETEAEAKALIAGLLEDIDGIESVDILRSMRAVAAAALKKNPSSVDFSPAELSDFIKNDNAELKKLYDAFISRHGHRAIREAEMRSKSWKSDEAALCENILTVMKTGAAEPPKAASHYKESLDKVLNGKKGAAKGGLNFLINQSRLGVYSREYTKSAFVRAADIFKTAYARLADDMVKCGALPEQDLIYFLTHKEIGQLIIDKKASLIKRAMQRRRLMSEQRTHKYKDVYVGKPKPFKAENIMAKDGTTLTGAPISRGEVTGIARVVLSVEDAKELKSGEIMVAAFTDIGWSPYYSVIGGLITEVGSALSHGAVVAREYALPLIVNVTNATAVIKTGDEIKLDANAGTVTILKKA